MQTKSPANKPQALWTYLIPPVVRRFWQWATLVHSDDPLRGALNRGFANIIVVFMIISTLLGFALVASGETAAAMVSVVSFPIQVLMWWLNRRGTVYGAVLYVLWVIAAIVLGSPPASYAGADTPIPLLLIFPIIIATLFIRPRAGLGAFILTMVVLAIQLALSDVPREHALRFLIIGSLDLVALTILLMVGALIFSRALQASIGSNEALRRQQEQFHYAALATQDAIYDLDLRTNTVIRNEAYQRLYGANNPNDAVQSWWESRVHPDDFPRVSASMQTVFHNQSDFWSAEYRLRRLDGQYAYVIDRAYIIYDPDGQPIRMIGAMADITERKQAEVEHLELALARERAELLKEFVDTLSHDLKTPLTIMNTSLYLLEKATNPENQHVKVELIKEQVQHIGKLIQDILTLSRLDTLPDFVPQRLEINTLILQVQSQLKSVAEERHITLKLDLSPNPVPVWGAEDDVLRAFMNLVENALRYTPANGTVTIRTFTQAGQGITEITDTGIGIGEDDLPHIFEHFYRADKAQAMDDSGTGLGLAIVRKIVKKQQGSIEVESFVGQGTTFRVMLPRVQENSLET